MKQFQLKQKRERLEKAEARICNLKATLHYTENGLPRQKTLNAHTEENLFEQAFHFGVQNDRNHVRLTQLQYDGNNLNWDNRIAVYAHYCFAKGRISFTEFRKVIFEEEVKVIA